MTVCLVGDRSADAADRHWQVANGDWHVGSNWGGTAPGSSDVAYIANNGTANIQTATGNVAVNWIRNGFVGGNLSGAVVQNDNTLAANIYWLGYADDVGTHTLNDGTLNVGTLYISEGTAASGVTQTGGIANVTNFYLGSNQANADGYYNLQNGELNVTSRFYISDTNGSNVSGVFTQTGGTVTSSVTLEMGDRADTSGAAIYNLDDGTLQIDHATPFLFRADPAPIYFDFDGGTLNLLGTWNYTNLTAIANSDFRFHGSPLQDGDLIFTAGTGPLTGYTVITIPEPSTSALAALGLLGLIGFGRRTKDETI